MRRLSFEHNRSRPVATLALLAMLWTTASASRGAVVFTPPDDSVDAANELKGIERELSDRNYPAAARRLDVLLSARGNPLSRLSEGALTSVGAWVDQLPADARPALAAECGKLMGPAARQALESLGKGRAPRPDEFYSLARRYPMTDAAGAALARAGDLALRGGDLPAAQAYYELALREAFTPDDARQRRLQSLREINAGAVLPAPADLESPGSPDGAKPHAADRLPFAGPLPFDATWFGNTSAAGHSKYFPAAYDDRILLASWRNVTMLREDGQVLWNSSNAKAPAAFATDRATSGGRGALFAPATLCDVHGRPAVIVVRQPGAQGDAQFVLRALRASDGKALWSTGSGSANADKDLTYAGLPAVCGRYVYSVAVARTGVSTANLVLSALDVATGQPLWQTTLGVVTEQGERGGAGDRRFGRKFGRDAPLALEPFAELSEPAVAGELVVVAPNCGSVIAVGRFDGLVRWVGAYRAPDAANRPQAAGDRANRWMQPGEGERALLTRYRSTPLVCGNVVVAMPQDAPALFAFDRATGRRLWETDLAIADAFGLAGASGDMAVACGATLAGIDAGGTGKLKWKYTPPRGVHLTGPAVVVGATVLAPTTRGVLQLNAADGAEKPTYALPDFRHLLTTDPGRSATTEAGAAQTFGFPPAAR